MRNRLTAKSRYRYITSNRQHLNDDDSMEDKSEDYQNCSVLCCVYDSCTQWYPHTHEHFCRWLL